MSACKIDVPGKQIYIIDDASSDNSQEIIQDYLQKLGVENVIFIRKPENKGAIDSVLTFLSMCSSEYVYFMASDDVALPLGIRSLVDTLEANLSLQFVIGGGKNVLEGGIETPLYGIKHNILLNLAQPDLTKTFFLADVSPMLCQSSVFRLRAIQEVGGFNRDIVADDYALFAKLFMRYGRRGIDFEFKPQVDCVLYRHHGSNSYRNLGRQAEMHLQVIHSLAPREIRSRAAGYRLAFFILVCFRRGSFTTSIRIARMSKLDEMPWLLVGLFTNLRDWLGHRR